MKKIAYISILLIIPIIINGFSFLGQRIRTGTTLTAADFWIFAIATFIVICCIAVGIGIAKASLKETKK